MTSHGDEDIRTRVFKQVRLCMENLAGGSGHLGCYHLSEGTFRIEETRDLGDGLTEYLFSVTGWLEDEFTCAEPIMDEASPDNEAGGFPVKAVHHAGVESPDSRGAPMEPGLLLPPLPSFDPCDNGTLLRGSLVLDSCFRIVLDSQGRVRLHPWRTLDPEFWMRGE